MQNTLDNPFILKFSKFINETIKFTLKNLNSPSKITLPQNSPKRNCLQVFRFESKHCGTRQWDDKSTFIVLASLTALRSEGEDTISSGAPRHTMSTNHACRTDRGDWSRTWDTTIPLTRELSCTTYKIRLTRFKQCKPCRLSSRQ